MKTRFSLLLFVVIVFVGGCKAPDPDLTQGIVGVWEGARTGSYPKGAYSEMLRITFEKTSNSTLNANVRYIGKGQDEVIAGGKTAIVYFDYGYNFKIDQLDLVSATAIKPFNKEVVGIHSDSQGGTLPALSKKIALSFSISNNKITVTTTSPNDNLRYNGTVEMTKL